MALISLSIFKSVKSLFKSDESNNESPFNLRRNFDKLMGKNVKSIEYGSLNFLKTVSLLLLIVFHTCESSFYLLDISNIGVALDLMKGLYGQILANLISNVKVLLFVSGFLSNYCYPITQSCHESPKDKTSFKKRDDMVSAMNEVNFSVDLKKLLKNIINRYLRITLPMLAMIALFTPFLDLTSIYINESSPQSMRANYNYSGTCRRFLWRNLLLINNLFDIQEMCHGQTWQLSSDFQLFVALRIVDFILSKLFLYYKKQSAKQNKLEEKNGVQNKSKLVDIQAKTYICLIIFSQLISSYYTYANNYQVFKNRLTFERRMRYFDFYQKIHINTFVRITPYCIGSLTCMYITYRNNASNQAKKDTRQPRGTWMKLRLTHLLALTLLVMFFFQSVVERNIQLSRTVNATIAFSYQPFYCFALSLFVIIANDKFETVKCKKTDELIEKKSLINSFVSHKIWYILSNLGYSWSLIHLSVIVFTYGSLRTSFEFSHTLMAYFATGNIVVTVILSIFFHLLIEIPLVNYIKL